jgi:hypothetical protein
MVQTSPSRFEVTVLSMELPALLCVMRSSLVQPSPSSPCTNA